MNADMNHQTSVAEKSSGVEGITPLKILWVLPYLPWPTTSGGKLRQYHLLRSLALQGHQITLLVQSKEVLSAVAQAHLATIVQRLIVLPRRPLKHPLTLLAAAFAPYPMLACVNGFAPKLTQIFRQLLSETWDVVQIEHSYTLQPFLAELVERRQPFVLTEHNVESSLGAATYQHLPKWLKPYIAYDQWRFRRWERQALQSPTVLAAVTESDAAGLAAISGRKVDVVINGVDTETFAAVVPAYDSKRILFVGNFEYPPNKDAVLWCLNEILPLVWRQLPEVSFAVCGFALLSEWVKTWTDKRIEWLGFVPDLKVQQQSSAVFLAALREGGGSKLKVLEALAAGLPLVSTSQGVSGLQLDADDGYLLGNTAEELAQGLIRVLTQYDLAQTIGDAGRAYVRAHHDWSLPRRQLEILYKRLSHAHRP